MMRDYVFDVGFVGTLMLASIGCATTPPAAEETREWPCGSIETGGYYGLANIEGRYQYDDHHHVVWRQETNREPTGNYGKVMKTETKTFDGDTAVFEELVADAWHTKTTRELDGRRIARETAIQYGFEGHTDVITASVWSYDGEHVTRIDYRDGTSGQPSGYSVFSYPDADTRVERQCSINAAGAESCSIVTLIGGPDTWTRSVTDDDADGHADYEQTRTLDANGLPLVIEYAYLPTKSGAPREVTKHIEIERRADGAPLFEDDGFTQTQYVFSCGAI